MLGAGSAGFLLLPGVGFTRTLQICVAANLAPAVAALLLSRRRHGRAPRHRTGTLPPPSRRCAVEADDILLAWESRVEADRAVLVGPILEDAAGRLARDGEEPARAYLEKICRIDPALRLALRGEIDRRRDAGIAVPDYLSAWAAD